MTGDINGGNALFSARSTSNNHSTTAATSTSGSSGVASGNTFTLSWDVIKHVRGTNMILCNGTNLTIPMTGLNLVQAPTTFKETCLNYRVVVINILQSAASITSSNGEQCD